MSTDPYSQMALIGADSDFDFYDLRNHLVEVCTSPSNSCRAILGKLP